MFGKRTKDIIISYKNLRRLIGILGISLPFLCLLGLLITLTPLQTSISHCYYTNIRDVFVGIMIGVSMFLITYNGYDDTDDRVTNFTGIFGIGLALCPCLFEVGTKTNVGYFNLNPLISNIIHTTCAALFFLLLAYNSIFLFTKTKDKNSMTINKKKRNIVYITCGIVMVVLMLLLVVLVIMLGQETFNSEPIAFTIESFMLFAFGISWLVKGETIFRDKVNTTTSNI
jgi:hypothetical protein